MRARRVARNLECTRSHAQVVCPLVAGCLYACLAAAGASLYLSWSGHELSQKRHDASTTGQRSLPRQRCHLVCLLCLLPCSQPETVSSQAWKSSPLHAGYHAGLPLDTPSAEQEVHLPFRSSRVRTCLTDDRFVLLVSVALQATAGYSKVLERLWLLCWSARCKSLLFQGVGYGEAADWSFCFACKASQSVRVRTTHTNAHTHLAAVHNLALEVAHLSAAALAQVALAQRALHKGLWEICPFVSPLQEQHLAGDWEKVLADVPSLWTDEVATLDATSNGATLPNVSGGWHWCRGCCVLLASTLMSSSSTSASTRQ